LNKFEGWNASLAQLAEQLIRNEQVVGSSPMRGSLEKSKKQHPNHKVWNFAKQHQRSAAQ
jgi:hypothetical protein